jgi:hypothetical protein
VRRDDRVLRERRRSSVTIERDDRALRSSATIERDDRARRSSTTIERRRSKACE